MKIRGFEVVSGYSDTIGTVDDELSIIHGKDKFSFKMPARATKGSAGYDIFNNTGEDIVLDPGESKVITTYLKSYMLIDEVLQLLPRSGHGFKYLVRLGNTVGVIDSDYYDNPKNEGEIFVKLTNPERSGKALVIPHGEGMCQGIFQKILFIDGDIGVNTERDGGIGSTNKKQ